MAQDATRKASGPLTALLVSPNRRILSELRPLLAQRLPAAEVVEFEGHPSLQELGEMFRTSSPALCFLDSASEQERTLLTISDLLGLQPSLQVVVLLGPEEQSLILRCLRQGACEFLLKPITAEQFDQAIGRLDMLNLRTGVNAGGGKIYCTVPVKGACGASTIAANIAFQFKRLGSKRILLADLDPLTGTIAFLLKLKSNYSFVDAVLHAGSLDSDLWKGMTTALQGIDVLLPPESIVEGLYDLQDAGPIVKYSRQVYDTVVVDTNGAYGDWSLTPARECDELLLVTSNELPALQAAQRVLAYLASHRIPHAKIRLVVNRFNKEVGLNKEMIETALGIDVFSVLPSDYDGVQRALIDGKMISASSQIGKSLAALAERLHGVEVPAAPQKSPSRLGGLLSIFSRG